MINDNSGQAFNPVVVGSYFNVKMAPFNAFGDGINDDTAAIALAYASIPSSGGVLFFPPGVYKTSGTLIPRNGITIYGASFGGLTAIAGPSTGGVCILYTGIGFWIDQNSAAGLVGFILQNIAVSVIDTTTPSGGAVRIGDPTQTFAGSTSRTLINFHNCTFTGAGSNVAGKTMVSLTMVAESLITNCSVYNVEQAWINDRTTANTYQRLRLSAFRYGLLITAKDAPGGAQDVYVQPDILGPDYSPGGTGYLMKIDSQNIDFYGGLLENIFNVTSKAFIWFTNKGREVHYFGGLFAVSAGNVTNALLFDNGSVRNRFFGTQLGATVGVNCGVASVGTLTGPAGNNYHQFIGCNDAMALVATNANTLIDGVSFGGSGTTRLTNLQPFANNAAAILGGLAIGDRFYELGSNPARVCVVV